MAFASSPLALSTGAAERLLGHPAPSRPSAATTRKLRAPLSAGDEFARETTGPPTRLRFLVARGLGSLLARQRGSESRAGGDASTDRTD